MKWKTWLQNKLYGHP